MSRDNPGSLGLVLKKVNVREVSISNKIEEFGD